MLIGSSSRAYCCVILEHAVLNRMLKADVLDTSLCVETGRGEGGCRESGVLGLFSSAFSGCRRAFELWWVCFWAHCDDSGGGGEV